MFITGKLKTLIDELYSVQGFLFNVMEILHENSDFSTLDIYQISEQSQLADDVSRFNEIIQKVRSGEISPRDAKEEFRKAHSEICKLYNQMLIIQLS